MARKFLAYLARLSAIGAAVALSTSSALPADMAAVEPLSAAPSLADVAFGVAGVTDYRFRGISNSAKDPAVQGYAELQALDWLYAGVWATSVKFPAPWERSSTAAEIDFYGGLRHSWGPVTLDVGGLYYYYAGEHILVPGLVPTRQKIDYWELYAKPTVVLGELATLGGNLFWTSDFMNLGSDALYVSLIPKINIPVSAFPNLGFYVSGEIGKQLFSKSTRSRIQYDWNDYLTWNLGGGATYKSMTLDVRYSDTDLSRRECAFNYNVRNLCGAAVVGKLSFDTALSALK